MDNQERKEFIDFLLSGVKFLSGGAKALVNPKEGGQEMAEGIYGSIKPAIDVFNPNREIREEEAEYIRQKEEEMDNGYYDPHDGDTGIRGL